MADPLKYPKLRWPIEIRREKLKDIDVIVLSCPLGISEKPLILLSSAMPILASFQGVMNIDEISGKFEALGVRREIIEDLIKLLDEYLFLASPRFFAAQNEAEESFRNAPLRKAALAGGGYPGNAFELSAEIDSLLVTHRPQKTLNSKLIALMVPHIDYQRGASAYALAYNYISPDDRAIYLLIGTAHQFGRSLFSLTTKDFEIPIGVARCSKEFIRNLTTLYGSERSFADELLHKREHSIELQLPFLLRREPNAEIVPILVGSFYQMLSSHKLPESYPEYADFVLALTECIKKARKDGREVRIIAGVDMSHVGAQFGDSEALNAEYLKYVRDKDEIYLNAIAACDKEKLYAHIAEDDDGRRICGFPIMYTIIDLLKRLGSVVSFQLFSYEQAVDVKQGRCVTFASGGFFEAWKNS